MKITFANNKVEKTMTDATLLVRKIGPQLAKATIKRKNQLESLSNIVDLFASGLDNPHWLEGNEFYGCIGWSITGNVRLILDTGMKPNESKLDYSLSEKIKIKGVVDYHGGKNEWLIY